MPMANSRKLRFLSDENGLVPVYPSSIFEGERTLLAVFEIFGCFVSIPYIGLEQACFYQIPAILTHYYY